jgi:protein TonB
MKTKRVIIQNFMATNLWVYLIMAVLVLAGGRVITGMGDIYAKMQTGMEPVIFADYTTTQPLVAAKVLPAQVVPQASAVSKLQVMPPVSSALPITAPTLLRAGLPIYPTEAREQGIEGSACLSLQIGLDGKVVAASVKQSSGFAVLDAAALSAAVDWVFVPARQGLASIQSVFEVPVSFRLKEE